MAAPESTWSGPSPSRLALRLAPALLISVALYWPLRDLHQGSLVRGATAILGLADPPLGLVVLDAAGSPLEALGRPRAVSVSTDRGTLDLIGIGCVLLPALVLGTPRLARTKRAWGALALLLPLQVVLLSECARATYGRAARSVASPGVTPEDLAGYGGLLLPVVLWAWAAGPLLFGASGRADTPGPRTARNAACPCGSGRKWKRCCGVVEGAGS